MINVLLDFISNKTHGLSDTEKQSLEKEWHDSILAKNSIDATY